MPNNLPNQTVTCEVGYPLIGRSRGFRTQPDIRSGYVEATQLYDIVPPKCWHDTQPKPGDNQSCIVSGQSRRLKEWPEHLKFRPRPTQSIQTRDELVDYVH